MHTESGWSALCVFSPQYTASISDTSRFFLYTFNIVSEVALYRKYRPKKFADVIGQDHVVKVLKGAIEAENISHAYLFSGSRGTGKTSVARIFAGEIGATAHDVYEIDAASN